MWCLPTSHLVRKDHELETCHRSDDETIVAPLPKADLDDALPRCTPMDRLEAGLLVPVPEAEPIVGRHRLQLDLSAGWGVPAHITVLYPWMPPDEIREDTHTRLTEIFAGVPTFDFTLSDIRWFGSDVVYAAPTPDTPFRALTNLVLEAWPGFLPYEGEHGEPTPHLTIGDSGTEADLAEAGDSVARHLPLACSAREVWLMTGSADAGWTREAVFPLVGA